MLDYTNPDDQPTTNTDSPGSDLSLQYDHLQNHLTM